MGAAGDVAGVAAAAAAACDGGKGGEGRGRGGGGARRRLWAEGRSGRLRETHRNPAKKEKTEMKHG